MADEATAIAEAKKLPWPDRIAHANWKVRSAAFDDINVACNGVYDENDPCLQEFASLFPKAVQDSNAAAQDKALDALAAFQAKATEQHVARTVDKTCTNIINKALAGRITTVQRAGVVLLNYLELEQAPAVTEALIAGFKHKVPKVAVACIDLLAQAVSQFGTKVVEPKPILKALPPLLESKDGKARDKAKELVVELSRWVGMEVIRASLFKEMRDAMKEDIERAMQEVSNLGRPQPERLTRREQARIAALKAQQDGSPAAETGAQQEEAAAPEAAPAEEVPPEMDPYDFADPKDIVKELKKDFWEGLESKKWSDRKGALAQLRELCAHPKLASGRDVDYGDLNRELRKIITKDNNVAVVSEAVHCTGALAKGIRQGYSGTAKGLVEVLLEKFKEKNPAVGRAANESLTIMHKYCFSLLDVAESLAGGLSHASPKVKEETLGWLRTAVCEEPKPTLSKLAPLLLQPASKCAEEATPSLREAALAFMVAFAIQFGNRAVLAKFTTKMDETRQKRLEEMLSEAQAVVSGGGGGGAAAGGGASAAAPTSAAAPSAAALPARGPSAAAAALAASRSKGVGGASKSSRPATAASSTSASTSAGAGKGSAGSKAGAGGAGAKKAGGAGAAGAKDDVEDEATVASQTLSRDEAIVRLTELFGEAAVKGLQDDQWKSRLDTMEVIVKRVQEGSMGEHCSTLVQAMAHLPGWAEKNFQVMAKQFEVIRIMASTVPTFSRRDAYAAILGLVEKMSDMKLKGPSFETLTIIAEAVGPQFVANMLHKKAAGHKNPKILSEVLNWIGQAVSDFGLGSFNVKMLLDFSKEDLGSANAGVRNSAIHLLGVLHRFLGSPLADMIRNDVKPALMAAIEGEFAKNPKNADYTPVRTSRADAAKKAAGAKQAGAPASEGSKAGAGGGGDAAVADDGGGGYDAEDLLPRADISASITPALLANLSSANWKERKQGLDDVEALLVGAGGRIQPQLGDLVGALKGRMADSNKNLMAQALALTGRLARAMGKAIDRSARPLLGPALKNLSDNKASVRGAVVELMESWASVAGMDTPVSELLEVLHSPKCTGDGKADGIGWLAKRAADSKVPLSLVPQCLQAVAIGAVDKSGDVRGATAELVSGLLQAHSPAALSSAAASLDATQKKVALESIAKATGGPVPAAAPAAAPSRPATAASGTSSVRSSSARPLGATTGRSTANARQPSTGTTSRLNLNKTSTTSAAAAAALAQDDGSLLVLDSKKEERARKGKFRPGKLEVRNEEPQVLESEFAPLMSSTMRGLMFSKDFKHQCQAVDLLREALHDLFDEVLSQLDLLFRWSTLRILEANTQMLVKVLDLLKEIFGTMASRGIKMSEYDCRMILPVLVEKAGHNQDKIKADHRELLRLASEVHPPLRIATYIKDGLESKNNKTRVVCADELAALIERNGPSLYRPAGIKTAGGADNLLLAIARLIGERDQAQRSAALSSLEAVYKIEGPGMWRLLEGKLPDASRALIEERLKYTDKQLARAGLHPGYRAAEFGEAVEEPADTTASFNLRGSHAHGGAGGLPTPVRASQSAIGSGARPGQQAVRGQNGSIPSHPRSGISDPFGTTGPELAATAAAHGSGIGMGRTPRDSSGVDYYHAAGGSSVSSGGMPPTIANVEANNSSAMAYLRQADTMSQLGGNFAAVGGGGGSTGVSPLQGLSRQDGGEMQRDFHMCLQKLAAGDVEEAVQVMKLFCYELMDQGSSNGAPVAALFQANMDQVISILTQRSDEIFASACDAAAHQEPANSRACKYALNTLMNVFQSPSLGQVISKDTLRPLMSVLLCCLVDEMVGILPEGMAMLKALNLLMMKILENSDRTAVFQALMELLLAPHHRLAYAPNSAKAEQGWYDLVVKCMIKITKNLPASVDSINIQAVLLSVHTFFDALGGEEIRKRGAREDKPLRMVKTVLHELCKLKGASIYNYTRDIPGADLDPALKPIIFPYIDLNLQTLAPEFMRSGMSAPQQPLPRPTPPLAPSTAAPAAAVPPRPVQQSNEAFAAASSSPKPPSGPPISSRHTSSSSLSADAAAASRASIDGGSAAQQPQQQQQQQQQPPPQQQQQQPAQVAQGSMVLAPSADVYCQRVADDPAARSLLSAIFKRIAENSADRHQALVDLYFFTAANPGQDIEAMLGAASPTFKNFIVRGLHKVRQQAQWQAQQLQQQGQAPAAPQPQLHASQPMQAPAAPSSSAHTHAQGHSRNSSSSSNAANAGLNNNNTSSTSNAFNGYAAPMSALLHHSRSGSTPANAQGSGAVAAASSAAGATPAQGLAAARLAMAAADSGSAGAPPSPGSPSATLKGPRAAPVVGEDKIAELRDRMNRMQLDMQSMPQRSASGPTMAAITAAANPSTTGNPGSPSPLSATSHACRGSTEVRADNGGGAGYGGEAQGEGYAAAGATEGEGASGVGAAEGGSASGAPEYGTFSKLQHGGGSGSSMATLQERMRRLRELEGQ